MNETLSYFNSQLTDFKLTKKQILTVTTTTQAASLANNIFGEYIIQNTLASAGSAFYYKSGVGFNWYSNSIYLKLSFHKFPKRVFMSINIASYNHCAYTLRIKNINNSIITRVMDIEVNSRGADWGSLGNRSGIYLNGSYDTSYCGYKKLTSLVNKTGDFDIEWNVKDFPDCYDDSMPCILEFRHNDSYNSKNLYLTGLEINL